MNTVLCRLTMLAMVGLAGLTSFAEASNRAGAFTLSPMLGTRTFSPADDFQGSQFIGLKLGYNFSENLGVELAGSTGNIEKKPAASGEFDYRSFQADLLYHFRPNEDLVPYFAIGVGGASQEKTVPATYVNDNMMFNYGAGIKYFLTDWLALRLDARHEMTFSSISDELNYNNFIFASGFSFQIGGVGTEVANRINRDASMINARLDSDNDGVIDSRDRCLGTRAGAVVDHQGCEPVVEAIAQPIVAAIAIGDLDQDGVFDGADKCPDTAAGKTVDADGCAINSPSMAELKLVINFPSDSAVIAPEYSAQLQKTAAFIKSHPSKSFIIAGHADSSGSTVLNQPLSQRRADAVRFRLIQDFASDKTRLMAQGFGDKKPLVDNATPEGRKLNRRVLVRIAN